MAEDEIPVKLDCSDNSRKRPRSASPDPTDAEVSNEVDDQGPFLTVNTEIFEKEEQDEDHEEEGEVKPYVEEEEIKPGPSSATEVKNVPVVVKSEKNDIKPLDVRGNRLKLGNFAIGESIDIVQANPSDRYRSAGGAAPPPKCPKKAHYMSHTKEEEIQYVEENLTRHPQAIQEPEVRFWFLCY